MHGKADAVGAQQDEIGSFAHRDTSSDVAHPDAPRAQRRRIIEHVRRMVVPRDLRAGRLHVMRPESSANVLEVVVRQHETDIHADAHGYARCARPRMHGRTPVRAHADVRKLAHRRRAEHAAGVTQHFELLCREPIGVRRVIIGTEQARIVEIGDT